MLLNWDHVFSKERLTHCAGGPRSVSVLVNDLSVVTLCNCCCCPNPRSDELLWELLVPVGRLGNVTLFSHLSPLVPDHTCLKACELLCVRVGTCFLWCWHGFSMVSTEYYPSQKLLFHNLFKTISNATSFWGNLVFCFFSIAGDWTRPCMC